MQLCAQLDSETDSDLFLVIKCFFSEEDFLLFACLFVLLQCENQPRFDIWCGVKSLEPETSSGSVQISFSLYEIALLPDGTILETKGT